MAIDQSAGRDPFTWELDRDRALLKEGKMVVLEMVTTSEGGSTFSSGHDHWVVRDLGFWNPRTVVEHKGARVATLDRPFFGSKARIDVPSGRNYFCRVRNAPVVRLSIHNAGGVEVLSYQLDPQFPSKVLFEVRNTWTSRSDLLLLIMLGYYAFDGIRRENAEGSPRNSAEAAR